MKRLVPIAPSLRIQCSVGLKHPLLAGTRCCGQDAVQAVIEQDHEKRDCVVECRCAEHQIKEGVQDVA